MPPVTQVHSLKVNTVTNFLCILPERTAYMIYSYEKMIYRHAKIIKGYHLKLYDKTIWKDLIKWFWVYPSIDYASTFIQVFSMSFLSVYIFCYICFSKVLIFFQMELAHIIKMLFYFSDIFIFLVAFNKWALFFHYNF